MMRRKAKTAGHSSSYQRRKRVRSRKTQVHERSIARRRLAGRATLGSRPRRAADRGRRRVGGRIAGGKGLFELLVELVLRFVPRVWRRLARLFHPGGSVEGHRKRSPPHESVATWRGLSDIDHRGLEREARADRAPKTTRKSTILRSVRFCARPKVFNGLTSFFCNWKKSAPTLAPALPPTNQHMCIPGI